MILPDHEIRAALQAGTIAIEPLTDPETQIQAAWVDLSLGREFKVFKHTQEPFIDSRQPREYTESVDAGDRPFTIHPHEFILGITKEKIRIPADLAAYVDGRSSLGRLGVTAHITAGWIDPGFEGRLVLEISNLGKMPVTLYPGMRICKLVFFRLSSPAQVPYNKKKNPKYLHQDTISQSKIHEDARPSP
ncbi:MAG: dCTP deaminase [Candidatus Aenigmarchaeota archaeon]|nr:dCTP deaminase [Candidatus Aenigmarchaeota archaeon]